MNCILEWLTKYEAIAVWLEGIALVAIFIWDRLDAKHDHEETVAQLAIAQAQIKLSQNAERAWILTELEWPDTSRLRVVTGTSSRKGEESVETTSVEVTLVCKNEGRSPAWVDTIQGYAEIVEGKVRDLPPPVGHKAQPFIPLGPIAPGQENRRQLLLECPGHIKNNQLMSLFVIVEYRDIFEQKRVTTCGYTVSGTYLSRQELMPERNRNT
jgi:hypothetical protein